jgi:hypothetical protein
MMDIGMLWMDDGKGRDFASRVREAAASYEEQYGVAPSLCMVHEEQMRSGVDQIGGMQLESNPRLLPNYFWVGGSAEKVDKEF